MFKKKIISVIYLLTAASLLVSCGKSALPERQTEADKVSELNVSDDNKTIPEVFSVLTVSDNAGLNADGYAAGKSFCGFTLQDDGSITVNVDGNELPFEEAAEKTGCTITENSDGSASIQAPFLKAQIIVKSDKEFDTYGAESVTETINGHFLLTYSSQSEAYSAYKKLSEDENVEYAEPNAVYKSAGFNETKRIENWGLERIGAADFCKELSEKNEDLPDVCVAVIDSGIYYEHSIFEGRILDGGRNFCEKYSEDKVNSASDDNGHGTHCAGIICSSTNDNVRILPVKVIDYLGFGDTYDIYCGMMYAVEYGADIISMSLGGYGKSHLFSEAVSAAYDKGITVCVAAGNESAGCESEYSSVSSIEECVVVASVDSELAPSDFSNYENIDFAAPGEYILSAGIYDPDDTAEMSGTSMATPFVAACFADVLSADRNLSSEELYDIVKANSVDLCEPGYDDRTGWGMVNLKKFRMTTERVDDPELRPAEVPLDPSPDDPPKKGCKLQF